MIPYQCNHLKVGKASAHKITQILVAICVFTVGDSVPIEQRALEESRNNVGINKDCWISRA